MDHNALVLILSDNETYDADIDNCSLELWTPAGLDVAGELGRALDEGDANVLKRWQLNNPVSMRAYADWLEARR